MTTLHDMRLATRIEAIPGNALLLGLLLLRRPWGRLGACALALRGSSRTRTPERPKRR